MFPILCSHLWSASIIYLSFVPLITGKIASCTVESFSHLHSMSRDGMLKDTRKMSHMHIILIAGVSYNSQIMGQNTCKFIYIYVLRGRSLQLYKQLSACQVVSSQALEKSKMYKMITSIII